MMRSCARRDPSASESIRGMIVNLLRRREHRMIGRLAASRFQDQQPGELRRHLLQILEPSLRRQYVFNGLVVNFRHRITNGFGALPAVSIQTLLVCRYSRIASIPFSRPMPDRL